MSSVRDGGFSTITPFATSGQRYLDAGFWPIPVSGDDKKGIPKGFTGHRGKPVQQEDVTRWLRCSPGANIALRLPPDAAGLDVDQYENKRGADTIKKLEEELGLLPPTIVATARELPSGKYLYRIPSGIKLKGKLGPGVEIVQNHHRYVVSAPSIHHTGSRVRWLKTESGEEIDCPDWDMIPELPWQWIEYLSVTGSV